MKKQILSLITAVMMGFSLIGCEKKPTGSTMEMPLELSYASTQLFTDYYEPVPFCVTGNWILAAESNGKTNSVIAYNTETGENIEPELQNEKALNDGFYATCWWAQATEDGGLMLLSNEYKMRGFDVTNVRHFMDYYDADLNFRERVALPEDFIPHVGTINQDYLLMDGQGYFYSLDSGACCLIVFDAEFQKLGEIVLPGSNVHELFLDAQGRAHASVFTFDEKTYETDLSCYALDPVALGYERLSGSLPTQNNVSIADGLGEDSYYYSDDKGIFSKNHDGASEKVVDWVNSDFTPGSVATVYSLQDGRFLTVSYGHSSPTGTPSTKPEAWLLRPRTEEEIAAMTFVSLAALNANADLVETIVRFNRSSDGTRIVIRDYAEYNENYDDKTGYEMFKQDLLDGVIADIICTDGLPFFSLSNKGMFADLNDFMEADESFHEEDYIMNFFESMENGGRLERIAFSYSVLTTAAKTEHVGTEQGISMEDYLALAENHPAGSTLMTPMDKDMVFWNFLGAMQNCYIDTSTMTCRFDSPDFVRFLALLKKIAEEGELIMSSQGALDNYWNVHRFPYRDDAALIDPIYIFEPIRLHETLVTDFGSARTTLIGYPLPYEDSNGGMFSPTFTLSINSQSLHQERIWAFMRTLLQDDHQNQTNLPVKRSALEKQLVAAQHMPMATGGSASESEMNLLRDYIDGIRVCYFQDDTVYNILAEETDKYLAGDCTAEDAARVIQNRVSIYLSEQG